MPDMKITNQTISFGGTVIKVNNLTRVTTYVHRAEKEDSAAGGVVFVILILTLWFLAGNPGLGWFGFFLTIGAAFLVALIAIYLLEENSYSKPSYSIRLETASGSIDALWSPDKEFIDDVVRQISSVMNHSQTPVNITVNIDKKTVFDNIKQSTIINKSNIQ